MITQEHTTNPINRNLAIQNRIFIGEKQKGGGIVKQAPALLDHRPGEIIASIRIRLHYISTTTEEVILA